MNDSPEYLAKKKKFDSMLTLYGRNAVLEALEDESVTPIALHLSNSNIDALVIDKMVEVAKRKNIQIKTHDKKALSRISKNAKQDQGVALDIQMRSYINVTQYLQQHPAHARIIALDSINNPQNLGMILRSCAAGNIDAVIVPKKGSAKISPLVIKASAGALFKTTIIYSETLDEALKAFKKEDFTLYNLSLDSRQSLFETKTGQKSIFVLGNESEGVSKEINALCDASLIIPMNNEVESLNVAVTASLIAFLPTV